MRRAHRGDELVGGRRVLREHREADLLRARERGELPRAGHRGFASELREHHERRVVRVDADAIGGTERRRDARRPLAHVVAREHHDRDGARERLRALHLVLERRDEPIVPVEPEGAATRDDVQRRGHVSDSDHVAERGARLLDARAVDPRSVRRLEILEGDAAGVRREANVLPREAAIVDHRVGGVAPAHDDARPRP